MCASTYYVYDGAQVISEYTAADMLIREFVYGTDLNSDGRIDNCDSDILAANWGLTGGATEKHYYYHYDGLTSVTAISDEAGNTIEKYEYSVYGDVQIVAKENGETRPTSIIDNPYYFTGL